MKEEYIQKSIASSFLAKKKYLAAVDFFCLANITRWMHHLNTISLLPRTSYRNGRDE